MKGGLQVRIKSCRIERGMENTFGDRKCRGPLIAENIKTDTSVAVDIWMINACREVYLQREYQYSVSRRKSDKKKGLQRDGLCTFGGLKG